TPSRSRVDAGAAHAGSPARRGYRGGAARSRVPSRASCQSALRLGARGDVATAGARAVGFGAVELLVGPRHRVGAVVGHVLDALVERAPARGAEPREPVLLVGAPPPFQHE